MDNAKSITLADRETNRLLVGRAYVELKDASQQTFFTDDLDDFVAYVKASKGKGGEVIEYSSQEVSAWREQESVRPRQDKAIATCSLRTGARLLKLLKVNGVWLGHEDLEVLLRIMRDCGGPEAMDLLDNLMNFSVSKVTNVKKSRKGGNYVYSVSRESAGSDDFVPPSTLAFKVPVFDGLAGAHEIRFDFDFDFKEADGEVTLRFKLENLNLGDEIDKAKKADIMEAVKSIGYPAYWGSRKIIEKDDTWKYRELQGA